MSQKILAERIDDAIEKNLITGITNKQEKLTALNSKTINSQPIYGTGNIVLPTIDDLNNYVPLNLKNVPDGYVSLNNLGKISINQLPDVVGGLNYLGVWDALNNIPQIVTSNHLRGDYYKVSVAGSTSLGEFNNWNIGDWVIFNGVNWDRIGNLTVSVSTLNGRAGDVTLTSGDVGLSNVNNTSDLNKPISSATQLALDLCEKTVNKNALNGYAGLNGSGQLQQSVLPLSVNLLNQCFTVQLNGGSWQRVSTLNETQITFTSSILNFPATFMNCSSLISVSGGNLFVDGTIPRVLVGAIRVSTGGVTVVGNYTVKCYINDILQNQYTGITTGNATYQTWNFWYYAYVYTTIKLTVTFTTVPTENQILIHSGSIKIL